jgi:hypothetical protein
MKTRFLSGFLAVVGGGVAIVGCFQPTNTVTADTPRVVNAPPAPVQTAPLNPAPAVAAPVAPDTNVTAVAAVPTSLSPGVTEIAKLFQSNVSEEVLLAYINNYSTPFYATADEILYLNDLGVSDNVVTAVLKHKTDGSTPAPAVVAAEPKQEVQAAAPAPAAPAAPVQASVATAPLVPQEPAPAAVVAAPAPAQQVTVNYFYDTLSPYGSWVETDYGRCWRPAVVVANPGWRPYCDRGRWVYTDCGWYWASDYSWGWATFHYGRWCSDVRFGWVWVPDTVWGPSWVSWRYTSDHCGWAPLPPAAHYRPGFGFTYRERGVSISFDFGLTDSCYTFVPANRFCDPHPYRYTAPRHETTIIYKNSTVINNYIVNNNSKTIVNEGVGRQRIEVATKRPVERVAIHEVPKSSITPTNPDRIHRVGKDLVLYKPQAPEFVKPAVVAKPTAAEQPAPAHNNNPRASHPSAATPSWQPGASGKTETPGRGNSGKFQPGNQPASSPFAPKVVSKPSGSEQSAPAASVPKASAPNRPSTFQPGNGNANNNNNSRPSGSWQPRPVTEARTTPVTQPSTQAPSTARPSAPVQRTAPLVPSENANRGNSRFDNPRSSTPAPSYSAPAAQRPSYTAPQARESAPQHSAPAIPRQSNGNGASHREYSAPRASAAPAPSYQPNAGKAERESNGPSAPGYGGRGRF